MRKVRHYFILGFVILIAELIITFWSYGIVSKLDSASVGFPDKQHQIAPNNHDRSPDATFNGFPVFYHDLTLDKSYSSRPYSSVRCVGENYQGDDFAWMHRSCHFRFLCFNISSREFEVFARPDDETLESIVSLRRPFIDLSAGVVPPPRVRNNEQNQNYSQIGDGVSLASGTVQRPWHKDRDYDRVVKKTHDWFPTVVRSSPPEKYYALEEDLVFVPFHSMFSKKESQVDEYSVVWDDLFPIFTLMNMFQLISPDTKKEPLPMRYVIRGEGEMNNLTNYNGSRLLMRQSSSNEYKKLMNHQRGQKTSWTSQIDAIMMSSSTSEHDTQQPLHSGLVCAKDGVAGLGPLGIRYMNGKKKRDISHNQGKGGLLWMFRNYCLSNLGLLTLPSVQTTSSTNRIIVSTKSFDSKLIERGLQNYPLTSVNRNEKENDEKKAGDRRLMIESHDFSDDEFDITSRVKLMLDTKVFITTCSDMMATAALFLPRGASLIIIYGNTNVNHKADGGIMTFADDETKNGCIRYQDLLNNLSHVAVHWIPEHTTRSEAGLEVLLDIVKHTVRIS